MMPTAQTLGALIQLNVMLYEVWVAGYCPYLSMEYNGLQGHPR